MKVTFADIAVDLGARQVWRRDVEVHLTRKAFDLLRLLIERRPNAVPKAEIQRHLWPGTFVTDGTLQSLVFEIREALGDEARNPRFVRTVHAFGYAFCAAVTEPGEATSGLS